MAQYLAELYVSRTDGAFAERSTSRVRIAAAELTREGTPVRWVRSIFVTDDETCFVLCEAASFDAVRKTAERAALTFERIAEAIPSRDPDEAQP